MNKQKGFTIIELIVVIAIIAVLAAIVLVNVTAYIAKGKDASIKGNMASIATIAASVYDGNSSSYLGAGGLAANAAYVAGLASINASNVGDANPQIIDDAYCISTELNESGKFWCVDSTGYKGDPGNTTSCDAITADCAAD